MIGIFVLKTNTTIFSFLFCLTNCKHQMFDHMSVEFFIECVVDMCVVVLLEQNINNFMIICLTIKRSRSLQTHSVTCTDKILIRYAKEKIFYGINLF